MRKSDIDKINNKRLFLIKNLNLSNEFFKHFREEAGVLNDDLVQEIKEEPERSRVGYFLDIINKRSEKSYNALLNALYKTDQIRVLIELEPRFNAKRNALQSLSVKLKSDDLNAHKMVEKLKLPMHDDKSVPQPETRSGIKETESLVSPEFEGLQNNIFAKTDIGEEDEKKANITQSNSESSALDSETDIYGSQLNLNSKENDSMSNEIFNEIREVICNDEIQLDEVQSASTISGRIFSLKTESDFINGPDFTHLEYLHKILGDHGRISSNVVKRKERFDSNLSDISKIVKGEPLPCIMVLMDANCHRDCLMFGPHPLPCSDVLMKIINSIECETLIIMLSLYGYFNFDKLIGHPAFAANQQKKIKILISQLNKHGQSNHWMLCVAAKCFSRLSCLEKCSIDDICDCICEIGKKSENDLISRFHFMEIPSA